MSKHNTKEPFRAMKRYMDQMEKINRITEMVSRVNIGTAFEMPINRLLQQQDYIRNLIKDTEFVSAYSHAEKMANLFPKADNFTFSNTELFSAAQRALDIANTPAMRAAISYANKIESIIPKHFGSMVENVIPMLERISFGNSKLSSIVNSLNDYQDLFSSVINTPVYNNVLGSLFPKDVYTHSFDDEDMEFDEVALTANEEEELVNDITEIYASTNWQQRFNAAIVKWEDKNPIVMRILTALITLISLISTIVTIAGFIFQVTVVSDKAVIREEPFKKAPTVCTVFKNEIITVISEEQYWYQVEYEPVKVKDADGKKVYRGYIAKRTVRTIETKSAVTTENDILNEK